jgi:hypothetical protein
VISSGITVVGVAQEDLLEPPLFVIDDLKDGDFTNALSGFWQTLTQKEWEAGGLFQQALPGQDAAASMRLSHVSATIVHRQSQDWIDWSFATVGWLQLRTWIAPYDATHAKGVYMILDSAQEIDLTIGIDYRQVGSGSWEEWELRSASAPVHLAGGKEETVALPFDEFVVDEPSWAVLGGKTLGDLDRSWLESMALIAMGDGVLATVYLREIGFYGVGPCASWLVTPGDVDLIYVDGIPGHLPQADAYWFVVSPMGAQAVDPADFSASDGLRYEYVALPEIQTGIDQKAAIRFPEPYDAHDFEGVEFSLRADHATTTRVEVASQDTGLHLQLNSDDYKSSMLPCAFEVTPELRTYRVAFGEFQDESWLLDQFPDVIPGVNASGIWEVQFHPDGDNCVFYIESVALFRPSDTADSEDATSPSANAIIPGLESLGNPFLRRYPGDAELAYPRTVWDMQAWNGRIYLGHGDSGSNAGPIDVWYYAPGQTRFVNEFSVDDEQISRYCRIGDSLFIPGHDAMESWDFGNIYVNESAGWQKLRTIPNAIHVYDLAMYEGRLYAVGSGELPGGSTTLDGGFIGVSDDGGWSWGIDLHLGPFCEDGITRVRDASDPGVARFTSLLELQGKLFASGWGTSRIYELGPDGFSLLEVDPFPGIASQFDEPPLIPPNEVDMSSAEIDRMWGDPKVAGYIARSVQFSGPLVYIGGVMSWTPYEPWQGIGVFAATAMQDGQIRRVLDLGATWEPRDLTVSGDKLYVLSVSLTDGGFRSRVDVTLDLSEWAVALDFMADAPAFSIEVLDGYLYVGLGGVYPSSGNIYRAKLSGE